MPAGRPSKSLLEMTADEFKAEIKREMAKPYVPQEPIWRVIDRLIRKQDDQSPRGQDQPPMETDR